MRHVVTAEVAGEIVVKMDALPSGALAHLKGALEVPNEDKAKQLTERVWGAWDLPDFLPLWREESRRGGDHVLCIPRGFAVGFTSICAQHEIDVQWSDRRKTALVAPGYYRPFGLRDYQLDAVTKMIEQEQGVYLCPAGGGKTVTILGLSWITQQRIVVITDKANLLAQWRERAAEFLGLSLDLSDERSVGKIGDDVWEERGFTVALRQTLWSRLWQIDATKWFDNYGIVVLDECHHAASETLQEIMRRVSSRGLIGVSATPAKSEAKGQIVYSIIGPICAETTRQQLYDRGVLMKPSVEIINTELEAEFWPTHEVDSRTACEVPNCVKVGKKHQHRNNYSSVLKKLVEDKTRNKLIGERIARDRGHVHLVYSRQLKHLDLLKKAVVDAGWDGPIYMLRGEENAAGLSQLIADAVRQGGQWEVASDGELKGEWVMTTPPHGTHGREAVIFSTVADEGLDIPPIDRVHMVFPMRQDGVVIQVVGRGERICDGKYDSVIVDYNDDGCRAFADQARIREALYRRTGYNVRFMRRSESHAQEAVV